MPEKNQIQTKNNSKHYPEKLKRTYPFKIPEEYRSLFAGYFVYFQEFIKGAKGEKIKFELASVNGTLDLVIECSSPDILARIDTWLSEFIQILNLKLKDKNPEIIFEEGGLKGYHQQILLAESSSWAENFKMMLKIKEAKLDLLTQELTQELTKIIQILNPEAGCENSGEVLDIVRPIREGVIQLKLENKFLNQSKQQLEQELDFLKKQNLLPSEKIQALEKLLENKDNPSKLKNLWTKTSGFFTGLSVGGGLNTIQQNAPAIWEFLKQIMDNFQK